MTPARRALYTVAGVEALILIIVLVAGAIAVAANHLTWADYLQDVVILSGALGIGVGLGVHGNIYEPPSPPPVVERHWAGEE